MIFAHYRTAEFYTRAAYAARLLLLILILPGQVCAFELWGNDEQEITGPVVLEVAEPFIEMHTGPGRGYPVFNVVEQGETIELLMHRANWYKIRTADNKTGWTSATGLAHTLEPTGIPVDLPEVTRGDYLESSWRIGFTSGQLEGANSFSLTAGYRPLRWAGIEIEAGRIFDQSVTSDYYGINFLVEPATDWTVVPYVSVGAGQFTFNSRHKVLVNDTGSQDYLGFAAGAGYYIGRSIVIRGEYRSYSVSSSEDRVWLNAWTIGLNTFF